MFLAVMTVVLAAAPVSSLKVASAGFKSIDASEKQTTFFSDYFADQLSKAGGFPVTTASEISGILGLERQKQLLGCGDDSVSCAAELLGGLGADAVITGSVARLGGAYALTVKISATRDGAQLASASGQVSREADVLPWLAEQAQRMGPAVRRKLRPEADAPVDVAQSGAGGAGSKAWIGAAAGGVLLAGGVVAYAIAYDKSSKIDSPNSPYPDAFAAENAAKEAGTFRTIAFVAGGAGLVALGVSAALMAMGGGDDVAVSPWATPSGAGLAVGGSF